MVTLKWKGDELYLGATKMAEVREDKRAGGGWEYVLGPNDFVSIPHERKEDAVAHCYARVRDLLAKAGA